MSDTQKAIVDDYGQKGMGQRILSKLKEFGIDTDNLTQEVLAEIDHVHGGGYPNTIEHADLVDLRSGMTVLDIGCGIGGPARYFAKAFGCDVTGIDLTQEFVDVATMLSEKCGMSDQTRFKCANATDLPYEDNSFDAAFCLNVTMNIEDRIGFYAEVARVLKPSGQFAVSELGQGTEGDPYYPLPWARDASYSFLVAPEVLRSGLEKAGFQIKHWIDEAERRKQAGGDVSRGTSILPAGEGQKMVRGEDYTARQANTAKSIMENRLTNVRLVAELA